MLKDTVLRPSNNVIKIYIIHNAQKLRQESSNALLKTIEELKSYNMVIFTTTNRNSLLPTIRSRCQIINLDRRSVESSVDLEKLSDIIKEVYNGNMAYFYQNKSIFNSFKEEKDDIIDGFLEIFKNLLALKYNQDSDINEGLRFNLKSLEVMSLDNIEHIISIVEEVKLGFKTNINYDLAIEEIVLGIFRGGML